MTSPVNAVTLSAVLMVASAMSTAVPEACITELVMLHLSASLRKARAPALNLLMVSCPSWSAVSSPDKVMVSMEERSLPVTLNVIWDVLFNTTMFLVPAGIFRQSYELPSTGSKNTVELSSALMGTRPPAAISAADTVIVLPVVTVSDFKVADVANSVSVKVDAELSKMMCVTAAATLSFSVLPLKAAHENGLVAVKPTTFRVMVDFVRCVNGCHGWKCGTGWWCREYIG